MTISEAKKGAKAKLKGHFGMAILFVIVIGIIESLLTTTVFGLLIFGAVLEIGSYYYFINAQEEKFEYLIEGFKEGLGNRILLSVLKNVFVFLWSFLFVIPGVIKNYAYSLAEIISMADPKKGSNQCITESREAMKGEKWDLFVFDLSFIGWFILSILTFGILLLYVAPYYTAARTEYLYAIAKKKGYKI